MRLLSAVILIFLLITQTFSKGIAFTGFVLNQNFIAQNLCVNKNNTQSKCQGKCFLAKKMKADDNKSHLPSALMKTVFSEVVLAHHFIAMPSVTPCKEKDGNLFQSNLFIHPFQPLIFHPPA